MKGAFGSRVERQGCRLPLEFSEKLAEITAMEHLSGVEDIKSTEVHGSDITGFLISRDTSEELSSSLKNRLGEWFIVMSKLGPASKGSVTRS